MTVRCQELAPWRGVQLAHAHPAPCALCNLGDVGSVYYGANHPMKPHRLCMTHHMVMAYDLHKRMEIYVRAREPALAPT